VTVRSLFRSWRKLLTPARLRLTAWLILLALSAFTLYLDHVVRTEFEGRRWALPARVYARPLEIFPGVKLAPKQLINELTLLHYRVTDHPEDPGSYGQNRNGINLVTRPFTFWDGPQPALALTLHFSDGQLETLQNSRTGVPVTLVRLDPLLIGSIYPAHNEDRILVRLDEVPASLINGLIAVEDRKFYTHHGIDPRGMARALWSMLRGRGVQGGSTLTQQLVKNFFLSPQRTLRRKFTEVIMALLLELHYSKHEILEAYINEVYLGQDGDRAIHGFGLASPFYFGKPLSELDLPQSALLVGLVRGPSYYDPRHHPRRALARRNLVLQELQQQGYISQTQFTAAAATPLGIIATPPSGASPYPAFLDLVHRQLRRDYREDDLRSEGLQIITTLDPEIQNAAEHALTTRLTQFEKDGHLPPHALEGAVVVTNSQTGEIQALVGDRDPSFEGFNRALDALRPIGSLIKPAIYLTALERPDSYTLATLLNDNPLTVHDPGSKDWSPNNYDRQFHGQVPLRVALANSYNVATVRLGLALGLPAIMGTVRTLGVERELPAYNASLLGANSLAPIEVAQMYQTLANGGFHVPLRSIREVLDADGHPLQHYALAVNQVVAPAPIYLLTFALQGVVSQGTAEDLKRYLSPELHLAGKTGTTEDLRDSWFAGFSGDHVAVVWVGRDDNEPTGLTGATGAMSVWGETLAQIDPAPLVPPHPDNVESAWIDPDTGLLADSSCAGAVRIPFIRGSAPTTVAPCISRSPIKKFKSWFKRLFER